MYTCPFAVFVFACFLFYLALAFFATVVFDTVRYCVFHRAMVSDRGSGRFWIKEFSQHCLQTRDPALRRGPGFLEQ